VPVTEPPNFFSQCCIRNLLPFLEHIFYSPVQECVLSYDVYYVVVIRPKNFHGLATHPESSNLCVAASLEQKNLDSLAFPSDATKEVSAVAIKELADTQDR